MHSEREDLEGLLGHPGWLRLAQWAKKEWNDQIVTLTEQAANNTDDTQALVRLRQVLAAKKAVELVMEWPLQRVRGLAAKDVAAQTHSRVPY